MNTIEKWENIYDSCMEIASDAEDLLSKYVREFLKSYPSNEINGYNSRIKTKKSFLEKLSRKDYITKWEYTDNLENDKKSLCSKLPDFIGFRLSILFHFDEDKFANKLLSFLSSKDGITPEFITLCCNQSSSIA